MKFGDGIEPHGFRWVIRDRLAVCERPGGVGDAHRRVRRREELVWLASRVALVVVTADEPGALGDYDAHGVVFMHRPVRPDPAVLADVYGLIADADGPVVLHGDTIGDTLSGAVAGYLVHAGLVGDDVAVTVVERLLGRRVGPPGIAVFRAAATIGRHAP